MFYITRVAKQLREIQTGFRIYHSKYTCLYPRYAGQMVISFPYRTRLSFYVVSYTERARIGEQVDTQFLVKFAIATIVSENTEAIMISEVIVFQ